MRIIAFLLIFVSAIALAVPTAPYTPRVSVNSSAVIATWDHFSAAQFYLVQHKLNGTWQSDKYSPVKSYSVNGAAVGSTHSFRVKACDQSGCSAYSGESFTVTVQSIPKLSPPNISPSGGTFVGSKQVSISATTTGQTIRYTINNTVVTAASPVYTGPFQLSTSATVRTRAFRSGYTASDESTRNFTIVPPPFVARFEWSPNPIIAENSTTFYWDVRNVQGCYGVTSSNPSALRPGSGTSGPWTYNSPHTFETKFYCIDLAGNRFPTNTSQYLSATRIVNPKTYIVSAAAGAGGSISPTSRSVAQGSATTFTVTPQSGYQIASVTGCSGSRSGSTYTTGAITAACTVSASFSAVTHTVSATAGAGGSISPTSRSVAQGSTTTFTVTPQSGYQIASVTGCSGSRSGSTYTTGVITANCAVSANFSLLNYTVTANAGSGGAISPANRTVQHGQKGSFIITPNAGFKIADVTGCGGTRDGSNYTTGNVSTACSINATFVGIGEINNNYIYDALGRLIEASSDLGDEAIYQYDDAGNRMTVTKGNQ